MEYDINTKYKFEKRCIEHLNERLVSLLQMQDYRLEKKRYQKVTRLLIKKIAKKGFLRTHAFFVNWVTELFEDGELSRKSLQEICSELPWSWDQTKKYCDALEENGLLQYTRDSQGRKVCVLNLEYFFRDAIKDIPSQELRLFYYLKYRKKIPNNHLLHLKKAITNYSTKIAKLKKAKKKIKKMKEEILPAKQHQIEQKADEIANLYWHSVNKKGSSVTKKIESILIKDPSLVFSLDY